MLYEVITDAGTLILLLEVNGLEELPGPGEEQEVELTFYQGVDLDGDPSDNRSGEEVFAIDPASLDAAGLQGDRPINLVLTLKRFLV